MISFLKWLEANNDRQIAYGSWSRDGTIVVYIDGKRYVYITDAIYHQRWKNLSRFAPWKVLNHILSQVRSGHAEQIEPPVQAKV